MKPTRPPHPTAPRSLDVDYVFVVFGGLIGYSGDDINKFLWMVSGWEDEWMHGWIDRSMNRLVGKGARSSNSTAS